MSRSETEGALPDFLIIGAQKSGTTTLRSLLDQHPGIYMAKSDEPPFEELHFFDHDGKWSRGFDWYRSHFFRSELLQGEKTPNYLSDLNAQQRMFATVPDARLIIMLRNPVDRAYSAWNQFNQQLEISSQWGWEEMAFEQAFERGVREREGVFANLIGSGMYMPQISHLLRFYSRDQIHILITERFRLAPEDEYRKVLAFLGLTPEGGVDFMNHNVRRYSQPMAQATRQRLGQFYQPYNELLFRFLGERVAEWGGE